MASPGECAADAAMDPGCSCHAGAAPRDWSGTGGPKAGPRCQNRTWQRPPIEGARVSAYRWVGPDLEISLRAQPGARSTEVRGIHGEAIKIRIAARPIEGAANEALLRFLAEALRVPRRRCVLVSGETGRQKRVGNEAPEGEHAERGRADWRRNSSPTRTPLSSRAASTFTP